MPPLPSHVSLEQAKNFAASLLEGDPRGAGVLTGTVRQVLSAVLPGDRKS